MAAAFVCGAVMMVAPAAAEAASCLNSTETYFARMVNNARAARGLSRLVVDTQLNKISALHSAEMRKRNTLYHTSLSVLGRRITNENYYGENIGWTGGASSLSPYQEARRMFRMFMNSPGHRANILRARTYRYHGVGVVYGPGDKLWITHTFAGRRDPGMSFRTSHC